MLVNALFRSAIALAVSFALAVSATAGTTIPTAADGATVTTYSDGTCLSCQVENEHRVIDASLSNYASIRVPAGVDGLVGIGVFFPDMQSAGHRVGFVMADALGALDAAALDALTLQTYADGQLRESASGQDALTIEVLPSGSGRVRFKTTQAFDELRVLVHGRVDVASDFNVYYALASKADGVPGIFVPLASNGASVRSGTSGVCLGCSVTDETNVIADDLALTATLAVTAGLTVDAWLEVEYPTVQPADTKTGFILFDVPGIANDELVDGLMLTTYFGGVAQESTSSDTELELLQEESDKLNLAFRATLPFDAVRVRIAGTLGVEVDLRVKHAYSIPRSSNKTDSPMATPTDLRASGALTAPAPNPTAGLSQVWVEVADAQHVRVRLIDMRGREVATLYDGRVETAEPVAIDTRAFPSGVYLVAAEGETFAASRRVSVVR